MDQLLDYQSFVREKFAALSEILQECCSGELPVSREVQERIGTSLKKEQEHLEHVLGDCRPTIMLYGIYNAGKSTLLNALMGQSRASMADRPETREVAAFPWQGYRLLDTPGLDAPIEHEKISKEALRDCQVVLFVVSVNGAFEDRKIYEEMKNVVEQGKRLLIVLNDKGDMDDQDVQIQDIYDNIQKNLENVGFTDQQAANFRMIQVNAKDALDARAESDEQLLNASNIHELETIVLQEIKRVNGFQVIIDLIHSSSGVFKDLMNSLTGNQTECNKIDDLQKVYVKYVEMCSGLEALVDTECAGMDKTLYNNLPQDPHNMASFDPQRIVNVQQEIHNSLWSNLQDKVHKCRDELEFDIQKLGLATSTRELRSRTIPTAGTESATPSQLVDKCPAHEDVPVEVEIVSEEDTKARDLALEGLATAVGQKIFPKLSTVLIPNVIPPLLLVEGLKKLAEWIFGNPEREKQEARMREQIRLQREAEERYQRAVLQWRQNMRDKCEDMKFSVIRKEKDALRTYADQELRSLFDEAKETIRQQKESIARQADKIRAFNTILIDLDAFARDLAQK